MPPYRIPGPWLDDDGRPAPYVTEAARASLPADRDFVDRRLAEAYELQGRRARECRPGSVAQRSAAQSAALDAWIEFLLGWSNELEAAARAADPPRQVTPAQLVPVSPQDEITTTEAARQYGHTPTWWRILADEGTVRGRKVGRDWRLLRSDVIAYVKGEIRRVTRSSTGAA